MPRLIFRSEALRQGQNESKRICFEGKFQEAPRKSNSPIERLPFLTPPQVDLVGPRKSNSLSERLPLLVPPQFL